MKSTCIALAAAAASCGAWAQSSVTLYGSLDAAGTAVRAGSGTTTPGGTTPMASGAFNMQRLDSGIGPGSRLGLRTTEDLGGGLKAVALMEGGFAVDTGAYQQGGLAWGRQTYVGLAGANWSLTAGRQYAPLDLAFGLSDGMGGLYWGNGMVNSGHVVYGSLAGTAGGGAYQTPSRVDNSVLLTGTSGAFTGKFMLAAGNENTRGTGRLMSASLAYNAAPLDINLAFTRFRQTAETLTATADPEWLQESLIGVSYNFGPVRLLTGYYRFDGPDNQANLSTAAKTSAFAYTWSKTTTTWLGARMKLGDGQLMAQVSRLAFNYKTGPDGHATLLGAVYEYPMSRRTTLYATAGSIANNAYANGYLGATITLLSPNGYGSHVKAASLGIRHTF